ncbi:MAG TPA: UDP-N-acetylmuramoyl-tripeptide--D-alanyl-D-alanine ligase [Lachnospiraceae bacterium]|nr:UDP-N-acetylmuramoyl-tripeptide--D-alanyl-D-alanine ligase [Lachnospiraceae bacterium]
MEKLYVKEILEAVRGELLGEVDTESTYIENVQTDSRKVRAGDLFVAIIGERLDAHRFVESAMEKGAAGCLVSKASETVPEGKFCVLVKDTIKAMGDLAAYYLRKLAIPVVAVTGSVGKTTTKDMVASVLSTKYRTVKTPHNLNNHIGLPLAVFTIGGEDEIAVLEMGMNHLGEIDYLTRIAKPDVAVITNVGDAHIGILGSRENILRAKCEIFHGLRKGGTAVLNGDDALLVTLKPGADRVKDDAAGAQSGGDGIFAQMYAGIDAGGFTFHWVGASESCDYRAVNIEDRLEEEVRCDAKTPEGTFSVRIPALGRHMIYPAMTAAAVGQYFGLSGEEIAEGIGNFKATGMRMETEQMPGRIKLFNDTYNANTQSMEEALKILANAEFAHKVAVVGDMLELEDFAEKLHREVGEYAAGLPIDTLVTVGECSRWIAEAAAEHGMEDVRPCADKEEAKKVLAELVRPDTALLFKASRGMALEELHSYCRELAEKTIK